MNFTFCKLYDPIALSIEKQNSENTQKKLSSSHEISTDFPLYGKVNLQTYLTISNVCHVSENQFINVTYKVGLKSSYAD